MLINFHLWPAPDVQAWEPRHDLHWLGLSNSWYWLNVGGVELFRYSPALLSHWDVDIRIQPYQAYAEWFLAGFWDYLLDSLPTFLTPIPSDLSTLLTADDRWQAWDRLVLQGHALRMGDVPSDLTEYEEVYDMATDWWHAWQVDSAWLSRHTPGIWLWRVAETMHVRWDCRVDTEDGVPVWAATTGMYTMEVSAFLADVSAFHTRFMHAMEEQIEVVRSSRLRAGRSLNIDQLEQEQAWRSGYLAKVLASTTQADDTEWEAVREAITRLGQYHSGL